ncbi:hypothetical protein GCM10010495_23840 [Kitasatospora herbaricolor]|nr:hypothetical protein GCM10010495_23840 [Kitasatospora herbaricolor]
MLDTGGSTGARPRRAGAVTRVGAERGSGDALQALAGPAVRTRPIRTGLRLRESSGRAVGTLVD